MTSGKRHINGAPAGYRVLLAMIAALGVGFAHGGCAAKAKNPPAASPPFTITKHMAKLDPMLVRAEVTAFSDTYSSTIAQACDQMSEKTQRSEVVRYALEQKTATATVMLTNGSAPNALGGMFDSVIYASLLRHSVEAHWIPTVLHEEGSGLLETCRRGETSAWTMLSTVANPQQCEELRQEIEKWKKEHPKEVYVGFVRFSDLSVFREVAGNPQQLVPNSIFSLLYINPMPDLDPVASELRSYRLLTERFKYVMMRMPVVISWRVQEAISRVDTMPQMKAFVDNTGRFADATQQFSDAVAAYPKSFSGERKEAIDQLMSGITVQRQGILKDLEGEYKKVGDLLADGRQTVAAISAAGASLKQDSNDVISRTTLAVILIIAAACVMPLAAMLVYRYACRRMASGGADLRT